MTSLFETSDRVAGRRALEEHLKRLSRPFTLAIVDVIAPRDSTTPMGMMRVMKPCAVGSQLAGLGLADALFDTVAKNLRSFFWKNA